MDTRLPIQDAPESPVHCIAFNDECTRFACGQAQGLRSFRAKDCIRTIKEEPVKGRGIGIAAVLDDRYVAIVGGGRNPNSATCKVCTVFSRTRKGP